MKQSILVCLFLSLAAVVVTACGPTAPTSNSGVGVSGGSNVAAAIQQSPGTGALDDSVRDPVAANTVTVSSGGALSGSGQAAVVRQDVGTSWEKPGTISVTGRGQVSAAPDLATLELGTESIADTVQEARTASAAATQDMINVLLELEITEDDISTSSIQISTVFDYQAQEVTGYRVNNRLTVRVRDLSTVGTVIDQVTEAGGDLTRLQGVSFEVEDTNQLEEAARAAAVAAATDKADQLAALLGVEVGTALAIVERDGGFRPFQESSAKVAFAADAGAATPVLAGEVQVTVTLDAVFAIAEAESP